jgi:vesicle-fusing ATPase
MPAPNLAFTNAVFINPGQTEFLDPNSKVNYIQVAGTFVFLARPHAEVKKGDIAMNKLQRECSKSSNAMPVKCQRWVPNPAQHMALSARFEVDVLNLKGKHTIKEDELVPFLKAGYQDQALTRDQVFCADFQGTSISLTVRGFSVANDDEKKTGQLTRSSPIAILGPLTELEVDAGPNKRLTLEKSANNRRSPLFRPDWKFEDMGIGGLDAEFSAIFRRSFASRLFPPDVIAQLGIKHVKGMLLYGPPGTGKTLIARQIGKMLAGKEPKVVNGPEILNKYVGASEENIRKLFEDAEKDYAAKKEAADLHIIIFDEIDAICKQRGTNRGGTGVHDTIVNQLLSKIDGVESPNNILVIGMTNRKDMIDSALLRPGRLEVHVEIGLPDEPGRLQIWNIHTRKMHEGGYMADDVNLQKLAEESKNFSGAEIEGVVKSASSYALYGSIDVTKGGDASKAIVSDKKKILVTMADFLAALKEVTPAFGVAEDDLKFLVRGELIDWGTPFSRVLETCRTLRNQVQFSDRTPLMAVLLEGVPNCGKTGIIAKLAIESQIPYIRIISPESLLGYDERQKCDNIQKVFEDAYKCDCGLILLDNIERILEYVPIGPRFSNAILQCLQILVKQIPKKENSKLIVLATTSNMSMMEDMDFKHSWNVILKVPQLTSIEEVKKVFAELEASQTPSESAVTIHAGSGMTPKEIDELAEVVPLPIPIKQLLMLIEMSKQQPDLSGIPVGRITRDRLTTSVRNSGLFA